MFLLDLTLPTPSENLALDEALLERVEQAGDAEETLRLWESPETIVVVGRSSRIDDEVNLARCRQACVPVLRRASGGASIVAGPGCLMYAVTLSLASRPELAAIDQAHEFVLSRLINALRPLAPMLRRAGTSDLALQEPDARNDSLKKVAGNSLRARRRSLIYHGAILYDFKLPRISELLREPPRQPDYRRRRHHQDFVTNLPSDRESLRQAVLQGFDVDGERNDIPIERIGQLVDERYGKPEWNHSR